MLPSHILLTITNKKRQKTPKTEYGQNDDRIIYTETIRRYLKLQISLHFITFRNNLWYSDTIYSNKPTSYTYSSQHNNGKGPIRTGILALVKWSESFFPNLKLFFRKWTFINVHFWKMASESWNFHTSSLIRRPPCQSCGRGLLPLCCHFIWREV